MSIPVLHHEPAHEELPPAPGPGSGDDQRSKPAEVESADATELGGLAAQTAERRAKRDALQARGINPYPTRFERSATLAELQTAYSGLEPDTRTAEVARVAGRVVSMRGHGKLRFVTIEDTNSAVQLMFQANHLPDDAAAVEALVDLGDWVGATGEVITSRRGELSVDVTGLEILAKALRPLPDRWYGLNEAETRYRQREVDLLANKESRHVFDIRFKTLSILRERLGAQDFVEVETPILQPQAGGALARPFFTHANALDADFSLRIAPELYLKRLVVGGYERVFEIARNFRNEGIDTRHSPEFTSLEAYRAFGDFRDGMDLTEHLIAETARGAVGRFEFDFAGHHIDLEPPWPRRDLLDMLQERLGQRVHPSMPVEDLRKISEAHDVPYLPSWGSGKLVFELYDKILMPQIAGPVFIYHYPTEVSPLARQSLEDPTLTDRFELVIAGRELANGYSELNDPDEQAKRFEAEAAAASGGDAEAHPAPTASEVSTRAADELAELLNGFHEPGMLVIAGDGFEMLAAAPDIAGTLDAHPRFTDAVKRFAEGNDHRVVLTPGNHDGQLAWDRESVAVLTERLGVTDVSLACDLAVETGDGCQLVRVVHGNQFDQYNAFEDPRSPVDTPLGHHIVRQVLPKLASRDRPGSLLEGVRWCDGDPTAFLGSRLLYRLVAGWLWWLAVPFAAALLLRMLSFVRGVEPLLHHHTERWLVSFGVLVVAIAVIAAVTGIVTMLRVNRALADASVSERGDAGTHNSAARAEAARLIAAGYAGLISGHTHEPEISQVGDGFYANTGCATEVVRARKARFGWPSPFLAVGRLSIVELRTGPVLSVSLSLEERPIGRPAPLERLVLAPERARPETLKVVGRLPDGATWPISERSLMPWVRRRRVRRVAAFGLLIAGLLNVVFALLWQVRWTRPVDHWLPFGIHPVSGVTAVIGGLALAGVARGVRLGYRRAWVAALVLLLASTVYRLVRDVGLEGSGLACLFGLWLLLEHRHFRVSPSGFRRLLGWVIMTGLVVVALAAGLGTAYLGGRETGDVVLAVALGTAVLVLATGLPGREHRRTGEARARAFERARAIFDRYGGDTLDYFALRDDKSWLFSGNTLIAYSVINRIMLVSPDPIGPVSERLDAWSDAMDLADTNGWYISVLGASAPWLPIYRAAGLTGVYMGDEAIVDCQTFSLKGKSMKSLRGAYNRMSKSGYHVTVLPALDADAELRTQLEDLATQTRQGEAERGFSMTLSRMFDERDAGLLLAVCMDPEGTPVAFNQYVPASHVNGYSLDLMRRTSNPDAPNGLTDFVILETINWMAERGLNGLGLNFATMRAVVAGENGSGPWRSAERSLFHRFSDSMQIESLWNFNKKYDPQWNPRYSVADDRAHMPRAGLAIARAESVSELPVVGRFMKPKTPAADPQPKELVP